MRMTLTKILMMSALSAVTAPSAALAQSSEGESQSRNRIDIAPYIEASQVVTAELQPGNDVVTYTQLAAGVDAGFAGRNNSGSVSLRYERRFGWDSNSVDVDTISGVARTSFAVIPRAVTFEAGGLAARTRVEGNGATSIGAFGDNSASTSQIYSVYAGPAMQTQVGDIELTGAYQIGYTRVESPDALTLSPGTDPIDVFDESIAQRANVRAGFAPGTVLPVVGVGVGAGWNRQDISNLDQRVDDRYVRGDVTVPVSSTLALVGGIGYEEVSVSSRDALRDGEGAPIIGSDGRLVTDKSQPRQIAYETDGLIWDVGVMWRPSNRTSVTATYGRRYGSTTYYGSLAYAPNPTTNLNVSVYDNITGFGGALTDSLAGLGTDFDAIRNPITGDLTGCVGSTEGGNCALAGIGGIRSAVFRSRGVSATYGRELGRTSLGVGVGYDRRKFIAAAGTALAAADGAVDENYWVSAYASRQLDRQSGLNFGASASWFESGLDSTGDGVGYSAVASYYRNIIAGLTGTAAVGMDGITRDSLPDYTTASALLGLRYTF